MGSTSSTSRAGFREITPPWIHTVQVPQEMLADKMASRSDEMSILNNNTVVRTRMGNFETDGVKWSRGFTSGQHSFQIHFPEASRGLVATVGVGTDEAPVHAKGKHPLVGMNKHSWGICLRTKRAFHRGAITKKYPQFQVSLPDVFFMYLDADAGMLQFGSGNEYYGTAHSNIPRDKPLYPMLGACHPRATIGIVYMGQAPENLHIVNPGTTIHVTQQPVVATPAVANVTVISANPGGGYPAPGGGYPASGGGYPAPAGYPAPGGYPAPEGYPATTPSAPYPVPESKGGAYPEPGPASEAAVSPPPAYTPADPLPSKSDDSLPPKSDSPPPTKSDDPLPTKSDEPPAAQ